MFKDLIFKITEKMAPNFFPEILIPPHAASSQAQTAGEMQNLVMVVMMVRRVWLLCCLQCLGVPSGGGVGGGTALAADQGAGEQSSDSSGLRLCFPGCSPCFHLHRGHNSHDCG